MNGLEDCAPPQEPILAKEEASCAAHKAFPPTLGRERQGTEESLEETTQGVHISNKEEQDASLYNPTDQNISNVFPKLLFAEIQIQQPGGGAEDVRRPRNSIEHK